MIEITEEALRPDGEHSYWWNFKFPFQDASGKRYIGGIGVDITERKRAEEALKKAHDELEQRVQERTAELAKANEDLAIFHRFAEASGEGFGMSDFDGRIAYVNPALCRLLGEKTPEDVIGKSVFTYYADEYKQRRKTELIPALLRDGGWHVEQTVLPRHGKPIQTLQSTFLLRDENGNPFRIAVVISDITERKRAEEALQASEERFRSYFVQGLIGMAVTSLDKRWEEVNDRLSEILGYSRAELLTMTWKDATHPDDLEPSLAQFNRLLAGEIDHYTLDKRYLRKDGKIVYATVFARCFRRKDGTIDHILALIEDITQRKRAEEAVLRSKRDWERTFDSVPDLISILDDRYRIVQVNQAMAKRLGLTPEQCIGLSCYESVHGLSQPPPFCPHALSLADGRGHSTEVHEDRLGGDFLVSTSPLFDGRGQMTGSVHVARDITDRKAAEETLRQRHDELRTIYDGMVDGLLVTDMETMRLVRANASICQMLGYSEDELTSLAVTDIHPAEALPHILELLQQRMEGNQAPPGSIPMLRKDSSVFYAEVIGRFMTYSGRPCVMGFFRDITERRQAQAALQRERRTLAHMLRASDQERQLISYEIHDGLAQYLGGAIMQFQTYEHLKDKQPQDATKAFDGGMTMLKQSHFEARRLISGVRPPILDESGVVAAIAHLVHDPSRDQGPKTEFRSDVKFDRLAPVLENAIYRIVQEGLTNACKHSKSPRVRISLLQRGNRVRIEIRDWGIGFDPKEMEETRFGLAGIRERARLLGGKYRIQSKLGKGTTIVVELPVVAREEKE